MALIDRDSTPALEAASRANGRQSPGPRTAGGKRRSSRNALKHGCYSEALFASMQQLGEDPREFVQLRDGLLESHQPANPAQALLVEDLALLRWRRMRNERGQAGVLGRALERLQLEHNRRLKELNRELTSAPQAEVLQHGFYGLADSPGKYEKIGSLLESLLEQVRNCQPSPKVPTNRCPDRRSPDRMRQQSRNRNRRTAFPPALVPPTPVIPGKAGVPLRSRPNPNSSVTG